MTTLRTMINRNASVIALVDGLTGSRIAVTGCRGDTLAVFPVPNLEEDPAQTLTAEHRAGTRARPVHLPALPSSGEPGNPLPPPADPTLTPDPPATPQTPGTPDPGD